MTEDQAAEALQLSSAPRERALFRRMADRAGIEHRFSYHRPLIAR